MPKRNKVTTDQATTVIEEAEQGQEAIEQHRTMQYRQDSSEKQSYSDSLS